VNATPADVDQLSRWRKLSRDSVSSPHLIPSSAEHGGHQQRKNAQTNSLEPTHVQ